MIRISTNLVNWRENLQTGRKPEKNLDCCQNQGLREEEHMSKETFALRAMALARPNFKANQTGKAKKPVVYRKFPQRALGFEGNKKVILTILDGWGCREETQGNAIKLANTSTYDNLLATCPNTTIHASGEHVGLPKGQMGNSEVGHLNLGAGRIVVQSLDKLNKAIANGNFFRNPELLKATQHAKDNNSSLHIMGLVSKGGVHSSLEHLFATIDLAYRQGIKKVYVHAFTDGRDVAPNSAIEDIKATNQKLQSCGYPEVATVCGRYYAMDRDKNWERTQLAYDSLVNGKGKRADSAEDAIKASYADDVTTDEFIKPIVLGDENSRIKDNDAVIFINFRPDRARQITSALKDPGFDGFKREKPIDNLCYVCMTQYKEDFNKFDNLHVAYPPETVENTLGKVLAGNGFKQFRTAETEKYAHVSFFFNGGVEEPNEGEERALVPSPKVATYDLKPEMSAEKVTEKVIGALRRPDMDFILVNFANPDMVGHTGNLDASIKAVEAIDNCLEKITRTVKEVGAEMILTADHGNVDCMIDPETGGPFTQHTTNKVPVVLINNKDGSSLAPDGKLADIAPTVLDLMGIEKPTEMTGASLIIRKK